MGWVYSVNIPTSINAKKKYTCLFFKKTLFVSGDTRYSHSKTIIFLIVLTEKLLEYYMYAEKET